MIDFACLECGQQLRSPSSGYRKQTRCPSCDALVNILPTPRTTYARTTVRKLLGLTYKLLKSNWVACLVAAFVISAVGGIFRGAESVLTQLLWVSEFSYFVMAGIAVLSVGSFVANTFLVVGAIRLGLQIAREDETDVSILFQGRSFLLRALAVRFVVVASIGLSVLLSMSPMIAFHFLEVDPQTKLIAAATFGTLALLIACYIATGLFASLGFMIDQNLGMKDALSTSWRAMRGNRRTVIFSYLTVLLISVPGLLLTCMLGILALMPFVLLIPTVNYLLLTSDTFHQRYSQKQTHTSG